MANAMKNLLGYEITRSLGGNAVDLNLRWTEAGIHWRRVQAETYRIAARICECSETSRWCIDPHADCGILGRDLLGTYIRVELAEGGDAEATLATILLRQIAEQVMAESKQV